MAAITVSKLFKGGHNDALAGFVITKTEELGEKWGNIMKNINFKRVNMNMMMCCMCMFTNTDFYSWHNS